MKRKINVGLTLEEFRSRYFPVFLCSFFLSLFSASCVISIFASTQFRHYPDRAKYVLIAAIVAAVWVTIFHYLVVMGRSGAIRGIVVINVVCLLLVLSAAEYKTPIFLQAIDILLPLLSLLTINGKRHREMRNRLVEVRHQREAFFSTVRKRR